MVRSDRDLGFKKQDNDLLQVQNDRAQENPHTSLSGKERNHLFLSRRASRFAEASAVSGLDHPGDSRAWARLDLDRDGFLDVALVNANAPRFQLFRNRLGELVEPGTAHFVAVRLVGGNREARPSSEWSSRDAVGARVVVTLADGLVLGRERAMGEGLAAQNTATQFIGIGRQTRVESMTVHWPSGRKTEFGAVNAGELATVYEDPAQGPGGEAVGRERYVREVRLPVARVHEGERLLPDAIAARGSSPRLRAYTTMATWCASCKRELPQTRRLAEAFGRDEVELYGVGIDLEDRPEALAAYVEKWEPGYELLAELSDEVRMHVKEYVETTLASEALPCTVVTDGEGRVVETMFGVPTVSGLRAVLAKLEDESGDAGGSRD